MSQLADQIHQLSREEKLDLFEVLCDSLLPEMTADWPVDELDRRWNLHQQGKNDSLPLAEAMTEVRRVFRERQS